ncbi:MAG: UDP-N-acetylglucosamine 2-epimerase [Flavobacteriaceae bacterium]|nr:UDP-N-acetylglucosamine 2-epimerase [Flavobacteriaceae bacterium]
MIVNKRKICVVTGTRAEYGLLYWTMKRIQDEPNLELQVIATGMHLSPEFGNTYNIIENDGFNIDNKIECLLSSDTGVGISKSVGLGIISFSEAYAQLQPDIVLVLGDRFEIMGAVTAAMICRIPVAHCHGGEATEGLIDEAIRHSLTKMSQIHFACTEEYRNRIIQLGELPSNVYNVGGLGIENINKLDLLDREAFEDSINYKLKENNYLVTFHPVTLDDASAETQFSALIDALDKLDDSLIIFTKPNADNEGRIIIKLIDEYVSKNKNKAVTFTSLGQLRYLSAIPFMTAVVGNSSSGLLEVPSFRIPTVNIGDRQRGRIQGDSVINCDPTETSIKKALDIAKSKEFRDNIKDKVSPYGEINSSEIIIDKLKNISLDGILKKKFYNL